MQAADVAVIPLTKMEYGVTYGKMGVVDMGAPDCGLDEWLDSIWTPYLESDPEYHRVVKQSQERTSRYLEKQTLLRQQSRRLSVSLTDEDWAHSEHLVLEHTDSSGTHLSSQGQLVAGLPAPQKLPAPTALSA